MWEGSPVDGGSVRVESRLSVAPEVDVGISITPPQDGQKRLPSGISTEHEGQRITG
jgi:hypothetical protein